MLAALVLCVATQDVTVTGRLVGEGGTPVVGAEIGVSRKAPVRTDASGRFRLLVEDGAFAPRGVVLLTLRHPTLGRLTCRLREGGDVDLGEVQLSPPGEVRGRIVDVAGDVDPEQDHVVLESTFSGRFQIARVVPVDRSTGEFSASVPPGTYRVRAVGEQVRYCLAEAGRESFVELPSGRGTCLSVTFPVHQVRYLALDRVLAVDEQGRVFEGEVDGGPAVAFHDLPPGSTYTLRLPEGAPFDAVEQRHAHLGSAVVDLVPTTGIEVHLRFPVGTEAPTRGTAVAVSEERTGSYPVRSIRDAEFPLRFPLVPGEWRIEVQVDGWPAQRTSGKASEEWGAVELEFEPSRPLEVRLRAGAGGRSTAGIPMRLVRGEEGDELLDDEVDTDAHGAAHLRRAGREASRLEVRWSPWVVTRHDLAPDTSEVVELSPPPTGRILGRLRLPAILAGQEWRARWTGAQGPSVPVVDGAFDLGPLPLGAGVVLLDGPDGRRCYLDPVEVSSEGDQPFERDLRESFPARLTARRVGGGESAGDLSLRLHAENTKRSYHLVMRQDRTTRDDLRPGRYRVSLGCEEWSYEHPDVLALDPGADDTLDLEVPLQHGTIFFVNAEGSPATHNTLVRHESGDALGGWTTRSEGGKVVHECTFPSGKVHLWYHDFVEGETVRVPVAELDWTLGQSEYVVDLGGG